MTIAAFILYFVVVLALGVIALLRTRDLADYILGGRRLGRWVTALSAQASDMSGWLLLGLPGLAYRAGLGAVWMPIGLLIGTYLNWRFLAYRLRHMSEKLDNALTIPDYLEARFNDRTHVLRVIAALAILGFFSIYVASGLVAGGRLFETLFEVEYLWAVTAGAAAIALYTAIGGFLAVSWTDTLQGGLMFVALVVVTLVGIASLGGWAGATEAVAAHDGHLLSVWQGEAGQRLGAVGLISLLAWGLGYFGQPHILVRFMAIGDPNALAPARRIAMGWVTVTLVTAVGVGVIGVARFGGALEDSEHVFMALVQVLFHPIVAGVLLAAILAAVMSTADSQLLVASSAVTRDFYAVLMRRSASQFELVWIGRAAVITIMLVAFAIASDPQSQVLGLVAYAWAGFGATFGPVILISLWWPRMGRAAAAVGMIAGAMTVVFWNLMSAWRAAAGPIWDVYELLPGFLISGLAIVLVSLWKPAPPELAERARLDDAP